MVASGSAADTRPSSVLASLAGITALTAGAVYTYGALTKMTVLWGADQKAADTLPLFSLEELLVAGISELLQIAVWTVVLLTVAMLAMDFPEHRSFIRRVRGRDEQAGRKRESRVRYWRGWPYVALVVVAIGLVLVLVTAHVTDLIAYGAGAAAFFYGRMLRVSRGRGIVGLALIFATVIFVSNYFDPEPLPTVELTIKDSRTPVKGSLITKGDDSWYVAVGKERFDVIPVAEVTRIRLQSRQEPQPKSLFESITGDKFLGLPRD